MLPFPDAKILTLAQLRVQLLPTKRDALIQLNGGSDKISTVTATSRKDGLQETQTETVRDVETGALVATKTIAWTYYAKEGCVDTITIVETDAAGKVVNNKIIKHFTTGKQPVMSDGK
jgi:hypothetical protein